LICHVRTIKGVGMVSQISLRDKSLPASGSTCQYCQAAKTAEVQTHKTPKMEVTDVPHC
jgi:hypothetical protein